MYFLKLYCNLLPCSVWEGRGLANALVLLALMVGISGAVADDRGDVFGAIAAQALPVAGRQFAIVFDDGPRPESTPLLLDALKQAGMKATFSLVGSCVDEYPDLARRIVAEGHEIANRTWSNRDLTELPPEAMRHEIEAGMISIVAATGIRPQYVRPPLGLTTPEMEEFFVASGLLVLRPTLDSGDWRKPPAGEVSRTILNGITPGAIILAHESFPKSVAEMPSILKELSERGFTSLTVSSLKSLAGFGGSLAAHR